ncbi:MAG TPA: tetratricopeptide repeat protein, partial [Verrucomicrobiae bacterium]|nr:tetratricopeptide repeat protein [Verrucomicrobiae bacterium]
DPNHSGGLAYYEGVTMHWNLSMQSKDGGVGFSWGVTATNLPPEVNLDLRSILQNIPLDRVKVTFDKEDRTLQIASSKAFLSVIFSQNGDARSFGADRIDFAGGGVALAISDIQVGAPLALQALLGLSKTDLEKMQLPLRKLTANEFTNVLTIPKDFPAGDKDAAAAKKFQSFLVARCAQQATNVSLQATASAVPDLQSTREKAENGDVVAQANLAMMYLNGDRVEQNYTEAVKWLRRAAEQGDVNSEYNLGVCFAEGKGVPKDYSNAMSWYQKAAEAHSAKAMVNLGMMYFQGKGVAQNGTNALVWFQKAADEGLPVACAYIGLIYLRGEGVAANTNEAINWYRKAAESGSVWAQTELGLRYQKGDGLERNEAEAVKWYRKAAEQGWAKAESNLGAMYSNGAGVATNLDEAVKWFRLAADQGDASGEARLAVCYILGQGVKQDPAEAYKWLTLAAEQGDSAAATVRSYFSQRISPEAIAEGIRRATAFVPHPKSFPDQP